MKDLDSIRQQLTFNNIYNMIEYISRMVREGEAHEFLNMRSSEAHEYCRDYLMPGAWGKNVWHAILDDAIRMRREKENK